MPRPKSAVKGNLDRINRISRKTRSRLRAPGAVDLHFHGAFGIDLMRAEAPELDRLSKRLWEAGVAAFCPTTLTASPEELLAAVRRIGAWMRSGSAPGAKPLGIHLEGPFINPAACGAHPPGIIRPVTASELDELWTTGQKTLKILTVAPELLAPKDLKWLAAWCRKRKVVLSLGHSKATEEQARQAFDAGFSGVTHAWNALPFHHRSRGPLGAALGRPGTYVELIIDGIHVDPGVIRWTMGLHPENCCFVSDCAPAAATRDGAWYAFGPLKTRFENGACRLEGGHLAGGGLLLPEAFGNWVQQESRATGQSVASVLKRAVRHLTLDPIRALGLSPSVLSDRKVTWSVGPRGQIRVDSPTLAL